MGHARGLLPFGCHYGQSANFRDFEATALAAKVRIATVENNRHGGLHITSRARALRRAVAASTKLGRRALWHAWIQPNLLSLPNEQFNSSTGHAPGLPPGQHHAGTRRTGGAAMDPADPSADPRRVPVYLDHPSPAGQRVRTTPLSA